MPASRVHRGYYKQPPCQPYRPVGDGRPSTPADAAPDRPRDRAGPAMATRRRCRMRLTRPSLIRRIGSHAALHRRNPRFAPAGPAYRACDGRPCGVDRRTGSPGRHAHAAGLAAGQTLLFAHAWLHGKRLPITSGTPWLPCDCSLTDPLNRQWRHPSPLLAFALAVADNPEPACNGRLRPA